MENRRQKNENLIRGTHENINDYQQKKRKIDVEMFFFFYIYVERLVKLKTFIILLW